MSEEDSGSTSTKGGPSKGHGTASPPLSKATKVHHPQCLYWNNVNGIWRPDNSHPDKMSHRWPASCDDDDDDIAQHSEIPLAPSQQSSGVESASAVDPKRKGSSGLGGSYSSGVHSGSTNDSKMVPPRDGGMWKACGHRAVADMQPPSPATRASHASDSRHAEEALVSLRVDKPPRARCVSFSTDCVVC